MQQGILPTSAPGTRLVSAFGYPSVATPVSSSSVINAGQLPAFQPAPMQRTTLYDPVKERDPPKAGGFLTLVGLVLLVLLVLTPVCDSFRLLGSETYLYFLGNSEAFWHSEAFWTISFCGSLIVFFVISMLSMECCSNRNVKTGGSFMYLFTSIITALGLGLVLLSVPLVDHSRGVYNELMMDCGKSANTEPLYAHYNVLLNIRKQPNCINKASIENCTGFQPKDPYTGFLKHLELGSLCSGFCYKPTGKMTNTTQPVEAVLQEMKAMRSGRAWKRDDTQGVFLLSADQALSRTATLPMWEQLPEGAGDTVNNMVSTGWMNAYPPTLFTNANFKTTCEGAAAREIRFSAIETGNLMYIEGSALLIISVLLGFLKIASMNRGEKHGFPSDLEGEGQYHGYDTNTKQIVL